ncbi:MAG: hypothetical protein N3I86_12665, partial [Verrucomicrobiae bacterium]|nr:hypothetical protein [Verrucomicrobiae bacterium]
MKLDSPGVLLHACDLMLRVAPEFQESFRRLGWAKCADVVRHFAGGLKLQPGVAVRPARLTLADGTELAVFYKQYEYA